MYAIGIMSGTSLDGIDTVLVEIEGTGSDTKIQQIAYNEYQIPNEISEEIKMACDEITSSVDLICSLNFKIGALFCEAVESLLEKSKFDYKQLDFIASHGQTIYHMPVKRDNFVASTLQIGEPAFLANKFKCPVVSNFRVMDMVVGGQGAPLVPYSEFILFGSNKNNVALQNIGGIGNVTVIPSTGCIDDVFAFDTGPGNMMINEACLELFGVNYDLDGNIASRGKVNQNMLDDLMSHKFITSIPPKTTGREDFGVTFVKSILSKYISVNREDIISTLTMFTAKSMKMNYDLFILNKYHLDEIIISGGGSHNKTLMKYIKDCFKPIKINTIEALGYSSDSKEALAFAILGNETIHNGCSNVINATGARENVILGTITPGQ